MTEANGRFEFPLVPLGSYVVEASDGAGNRGRSSMITLSESGQEVDVQVTYVGLGTVTGRVTMPDGSGAAHMPVTLRSFHPDFGKTFSTQTDANGDYTVEKIPVGTLTVSAGGPGGPEPGRSGYGEELRHPGRREQPPAALAAPDRGGHRTGPGQRWGNSSPMPTATSAIPGSR